jgi:hypothetical protein
LDESYHYYCPELVEITEPGPVVLPDGTSQCSWSRRPYLDLNFEDAAFYPVRSAQLLRMKKWEMYHAVTPTHYVSLLIAWIGYAAFCSAFVYTRRTRVHIEDIHIRPPYPEPEVMRNSTAGRTVFQTEAVNASFDVDGANRRLRMTWPGFAGLGFRAEIDLYQPAEVESICATHPVNSKRAHYSRKINCMPASGQVQLADETVRLDPKTSFGMLDFGRGYYPDKTFWYWATASGRDRRDKRIGFNLGHGNDPSDAGENAVFYDGRTHKIGAVRCTLPRGDMMQPWRVTSGDGRVDLTLTPEKVRTVRLDLVWLHTVGQPAFGPYNGHVTLDDGKVVQVRDLFGLYEWFDQKW